MAIAGGVENRVNNYTTGSQSDQRATVLTEGGWVVTWWSDGQDGSSTGIYQQAYHSDGTPQGVETRVNSTTAGPQINQQITALPDGGWVVSWVSGEQDGSGAGIYQQVYNSDGTPQGSETRVNSYTIDHQNDPQITALADGGWVVTWVSYYQAGSADVYQQAYHSDGSQQGGETRVNTYTTDFQRGHQITGLPDGGWVVVWTSTGQDGSREGVYQQAYNADGTPQGTETRVNSHTNGSQSAQQVSPLSDGGWVVTWTSGSQDGSGSGIYQQVYNADGTP